MSALYFYIGCTIIGAILGAFARDPGDGRTLTIMLYAVIGAFLGMGALGVGYLAYLAVLGWGVAMP